MAVATAALALPALVVGTTPAVHAAGGTTLSAFRVEDSVSGAQITHYRWLVNLDNTGDPAFTAQSIKDCLPDKAGADPRLPGATAVGGDLASCQWPSTRAVPGDSPVIASGTDADVSRLTALSGFDGGKGAGNGRYLVSVTARDHKIDGVHFEVKDGALITVNDDAVGPTVPFTVKMNPMPKLTATVRVHVYNDNASTNGQWDGQTETLLTCAAPPDGETLPAGCNGVIDANLVADPETDMSGFTVSIKDVLADVTTDVFGNPLCTEYQMDSNDPTKVYLDEYGSPVPVSFGSTLGGTESSCISDHYGDVVIPNLGPNRYAASIIPPDARTHEDDQWVQTTTLEGGHDWDTWNQEGGSGYDTELVVGGERVTPVAHGFVKLSHSDYEYGEMINDLGAPAAKAAYYNASSGFTGGVGGGGSLSGRIRIGRAYIGSGSGTNAALGVGVPLAGTNLANAKEDGAIEDGLISINCIATCNAPTDSAVWVGRSDPDDGSFTVTGLQTGDYTVSFWDEAQSYILAVLQYHVDGDPTSAVTQLGAPSSAVRSAPDQQGNRHYYLNFASAPVIASGVTQLSLTGGNNGWSGTFNIVGVNGAQIEVRKVGNQQPGGSASTPSNIRVSYTTLTPPTGTVAGDVLLPGWFTDLTGTIFIDDNDNGVQDAGEVGVPDFGVTVRTRGNSLQDQGAAASTTGEDGGYDLSQAYPLGQFLIFEAYNPRYYTTGYNYTTDNDADTHVVVGTGQVDFNFLPIIGLSGQINVGVKPYAPFENGGIAGTVSYDVTRNEFDPAFSAAEDYQPSIPGLPVQLWKTRKNADGSVARYPGSGAVIQVGTTAAGATCDRLDQSRGTDAVESGTQTCLPWDYYVTEHWTRPTGCVALDVTGNPLDGELVLPGAPAGFDDSHSDPANPDCVEAPMNGMQIGGDGSVNGNYALSNLIKPGAFAGSTLADAYASDHGDAAKWNVLPPDDYVVEVVNPVDQVGGAKAKDPDEGGFFSANSPKHLYRFTDETSINVFSGNSYVPQQSVQPNSASDPGGDPLAPFDPSVERQDLNTIGSGTVALCGGTMATVHNSTDAESYESDFTAGGGSPFDGQKRPVCDAKVVKVVNGRSVAPTFFMYTDVPIPSKFYGLINDDLNVQTDRRSVLLGEVAPVSNGPVGIYDELGRWKYTAHSDVNGNYEVLLPSMDTYNCPLPAGPCANVYRLVGNDPGSNVHRNTDYNPQFRTIATNFQAWAGVIHPVDQAPTHIGITIEGPAAQFGALSLCSVNAADPTGAPVPADRLTPEFFSIDLPYLDPDGDPNHQFHIRGNSFGASGTLTLSGTPITVDSWNNTDILFKVPSSMRSNPGARTIDIANVNGLSTVNAGTLHVLAAANSNSTHYKLSDVYVVNGAATQDSGRTFTPQQDAWDVATDTPAGFASGLTATGTTINGWNGRSVSGGRAIQRAIEAAHAKTYGNPRGADGREKLIVILPNTSPNYAPFNAFSAYYENVVVHGKVKLQGVGPGGTYSSTSIVAGSAIDGSTFWSATQVVPAGGNQQDADGSYSDDWRLFANGIGRADLTRVPELPEGEDVLVVAESQNQYTGSTSGIDAIMLTGGNQQGNPGGVVEAPGTVGGGTTAGGNPGPAQGGAIMLDSYVRDFHITNNLVQSNGATYGAVRVGTPDLQSANNHNERLTVADNRFIANGGTNLAGALGLFTGSDGYTVSGNDFCGNFSAEYGGAISHYGLSPNGTIRSNRIYYNQSYDEGGGIMIAGVLPGNNNSASPGAGTVTIDKNVILSNQSNDDGGGVRFLMAGLAQFTVTNNMIANNLSTHEGAGIALDDAPHVLIANNTVVKNITTGTAATNAAIVSPNASETGAIIPAGSDVNTTTIVPNGTVVRPANPAGLATGGNSTQLQALLTDRREPNWSKPTLINNIFADNRTGWVELPTALNYNTSAIHGIGAANGSDGPQKWDIGVATTTNLNNGCATNTSGCVKQAFGFTGTTNVINTSGTIQGPASVNPGFYTGSGAGYTNDIVIPGATDGVAAVGVVRSVDYLVDSLGWRVNTNVSFPVLVAQMAPVSLTADYHLTATRPGSTPAGQEVRNTGTNPTASNGVPDHDIDNDLRPSSVTVERGADELGTPAPPPPPPPPPTRPNLTTLDDFNRSSGLGGNWSVALGSATIGGNAYFTTTLFGSILTFGQAVWTNGATPGAKQAAAFTMTNVNGASLLLKASGGTAAAPATYLRARVTTAGVQVQTTTNSGVNFTTLATFSGAVSAGDTITAQVDATGRVDVWQTSAANVTTWLGTTSSTFTGAGRIGINVGAGARVDNFAAGTVTP